MDQNFAELKIRAPYVNKPFPDYELTSLRGEIKRVQARIAELEALKAQGEHPQEDTEFDGGRVVRNATENRLQILFDDIPDADTRQVLKSHGFRWSPRNQAWQRQLTKNAEYDAKQILNLEV